MQDPHSFLNGYRLAGQMQYGDGRRAEWDLSSRQNEPEAAREILKYFVEHPEAADTLEGVAHWRLIGRHLTIEQVALALDWLVARGYLKRIARPFAYRIYSLDPGQLAEAERYLRGAGAPED